jgi:hypothetical protein
MLIKELVNKSWYGTISYIESQDSIDLLEQFILHNLPVLKEFKHIVVATNYKEYDLNLVNRNIDMWEKHFPNIRLIDNEVNRGHNHGNADLDNLLFDFCKKANVEWLCKSANDVILQESFLELEVPESDFYYLNGIGYGGMVKYDFDFTRILNEDFYPQTNFYFINVSKTDYLNDKEYLDKTYDHIQTIENYNNKIWEYIPGWSCEDFLKQCVQRNNLSKHHLIPEKNYLYLLKVIKENSIHDCSHKNLMIEGICHFAYPNQPIIQI